MSALREAFFQPPHFCRRPHIFFVVIVIVVVIHDINNTLLFVVAGSIIDNVINTHVFYRKFISIMDRNM